MAELVSSMQTAAGWAGLGLPLGAAYFSLARGFPVAGLLWDGQCIPWAEPPPPSSILGAGTAVSPNHYAVG